MELMITLALTKANRGTDGKSFAGFRACFCQDGFFRRHMFKGCEACAKYDGFRCTNDSFYLKKGYWWKWENETNKEHFISFRDALSKNSSVENNSTYEYPYPLPQPHRCPRPESCLGGMDSNCSEGYEGPLCDVCRQGYYKQLKTCRECPSKKWMIGQLCLIGAAIFVISVIAAWRSKKQIKKKKVRSLGDLILSKMKIVIGFYQVTVGMIEAFAFIKWPESLTFIGKYSEMLQLNVLQIAPIHCLFANLKVDAFGRLYAILSINAAVIIFGLAFYGIRKVLITRKTFETQEEKVNKISETKQIAYKAVFFVLYVTYLSTCSKTANVLPLACRSICYTENETQCETFLRDDFTINCSSQEFLRPVIVAYFSVIYVIVLPAAALVTLWRHWKTLKTSAEEDNDESTYSQSSEVIAGLTFLFQNYKIRRWYWEFVETGRKVILTSGIILLGAESRAYIGMSLILSGYYGMLFAHMKPIEDPSENSLMLSSLAVTYINLVIGAVSRIPEEVALDTLYPNLEKVLFDILVVGANVLVILVLLVQYAMFIHRFFKEWRKNPRWSFSCCLALLLPLNDLQQEVLGMTGKNVLKQQLKTGNVDMPSLSGALKESGAVSIELNIFPEHPEETSGSPSEETKADRKKKGNADKGTVSTGDEPEKQATTTKKKLKQNLQTDNVNMSWGSGAFKKSGAVRIVRASIHERPKKTRGSITEEKNRLPQDTLQQEIREMRTKNPLKQQLKTGNVNTPSETGALKKSGAVRIVRASIHERPKKTRGSISEEKNRLPQDILQQEIREMRTKKPLKQQLKTGNVNAPSESGALEKSGAVDFVLVTIHEHPTEACGSPSEERGTGEMKQGDDNKVATSTPEEEFEETRL
ncbi:putative leucine-rich repeat-containing protein DDB_G0281931 [Acropora millepora]|uniref:putative leucine-rich repeat-containing protein DDB_G0281931 n=1 Tax=Acropora millepora TaxID=45264 RepID=UPI001CF228A2|nr:putative leucine-rich repeat-containing protein DDB_G0281931 [Acropora millepora]